MKKLLLSLFVSFVGLISFCSSSLNIIEDTTCGKNSSYPDNICPIEGLLNMNCTGNISFRIYFLKKDNNRLDGSEYIQNAYCNYVNQYLNSFTVSGFNKVIDARLSSHPNTYPVGFVYDGGDATVYYGDKLCNEDLRYSCPVCPTCPTCDPQYTSSECQSVYDLVPSSDLSTCQSSLSSCNSDLQSCQSSLSGRNNTLNNCSNNLLSCESSLASCIQSNCPIDTGDVMWSSLWINGIQHLGKSVINVSIPDNIYWDYTTNDEEFDLYVGSGYDQDYIDGIISINSYSPTSEDFTSIFVSGLTLIMPYIIFALFIVFFWKLIKRIFK